MSMDLKRSEKRPRVEKKEPDRNARRRELYKQKISNKKAALLLQQQLRVQELERASPVKETSSTVVATLGNVQPAFPVIFSRSAPEIPQTVGHLRAQPSQLVFHDGSSSDIYEKGSSSITPFKECNTNELPITAGNKVDIGFLLSLTLLATIICNVILQRNVILQAALDNPATCWESRS